MPCQAKTEPLEFLRLDSVATTFDAHKMLYDLGYRGKLSTSGDSVRLEMHMADQVPVVADTGDVLLYKTSPVPMVVACMTYDQFVAGYDIL